MVVIDMNMPKSCHECCCYDYIYQKCVIASQGIPNRYHYDGSIKPEWCPIMCDINEIKTEIKDFYDDNKACDQEDVAYGLKITLDIINEHIKGEQNV